MHAWRGFTLIELVLVILLTSIVGAVVLPRLPLDNQFEQRLQAENLVGLLRQVQLRAMNDPAALAENSELSRCGLIAFTDNGFSIAKNCNAAQLLDESQLTAAEQQGLFLGKTGLTLTIASSSSYSLPLLLQFGQQSAVDPNYLSEHSRLGRPFINGAPLDSTLMITLGDKVVRIEPEGYVHGP
ncbi:prepilin-type N-terminal cleavage/methylation domain-containing protein [Oceanisphaera sp.]|uniref:prepilin-type N-terminal cleavage/methylation domain-containing protein n=1 Tax=Oceanisphaera sp. TaxID=1929979 RepID=UPI003A929528